MRPSVSNASCWRINSETFFSGSCHSRHDIRRLSYQPCTHPVRHCRRHLRYLGHCTVQQWTVTIAPMQFSRLHDRDLQCLSLNSRHLYMFASLSTSAALMYCRGLPVKADWSHQCDCCSVYSVVYRPCFDELSCCYKASRVCCCVYYTLCLCQ